MKQQLSKGCQCCQAGKWICVFLTYRCQAGCSFCIAPFDDDRIWTEFGPNLDDVVNALNAGDYRGVGFSGGDCFLVPDRLEKWLGHLHTCFPDAYYWVYTNGLMATPETMQQLVRLGMNEIRFNIAATHYQHPTVLRHIQAACALFEHVAVEIPSIPQHYSQLIEVLPTLVDYGIHYLNLHEFLLVPNDPLARTAEKAECTFNLVGHLEYDQRSRENTQKVLAFCQQNKLPVVVNSCSIEKKERQMRHRRLCCAKRACLAWEEVSEDGLLETYCREEHLCDLDTNLSTVLETGRDIFVHPDEYANQDGYQRVRFMPPMEVNGYRVLVSCTMFYDRGPCYGLS